MAQRVVVTLSDDLDGGVAEETVQFGLDGKSYEIDLSAQNAEKLRSALAPYVQAGRKQARAAAALKAHPRRTEIAPDPATVRAWAQSRGIDLPARGRLPKHVYEAFAQAS
ncbi:histone-like nucleoid-structuring protein Lsr2 [Streptacidiphilus melanogenes]|uniref:histone-like nucleoid-structuring protein Lsr2 n=1 Tax=Streptacidiphilus melanogenes TaxID=411235 RepID=UPI0005AB856C|nr:Lsr2 family protein [Streptacidiphilus melanogenes]